MELFKSSEEIVSFFRANFTRGDNDHLQTFLVQLREKGCSEMVITKLLVSEGNYSLREAGEIVLNGQPGLFELLEDEYPEEFGDKPAL
jgi:hypothetical protein